MTSLNVRKVSKKASYHNHTQACENGKGYPGHQRRLDEYMHKGHHARGDSMSAGMPISHQAEERSYVKENKNSPIVQDAHDLGDDGRAQDGVQNQRRHCPD
jgi:hypothetical protein